MTMIVAGVVGVVGLGVGAYEASVQAGIAGSAESLASAQFGNQQWYNQQLQNLIMNPSSWTGSSIFNNALNIGSQAVSRQQIAGGFGGSGNSAIALEQYGQGTALNSLQAQEQLLMQGAGVNVNPASALSTASGAASTGAQQLSGGMNTAMMAAVLGSSGYLGGGSPSYPGGDPGSNPESW